MYNRKLDEWIFAQAEAIPLTEGGSAMVPVTEDSSPETVPETVPEEVPESGRTAGNPDFCTARFLNSAEGYDLMVRIGSAVYVQDLSFGALSPYELVPDGFRTVRIAAAGDPNLQYLQKTIPFRAGDVITLVIVKTARGLDLVSVSDAPCRAQPTDVGCLRIANMAYDAPGLDLILDDAKLIFTDVRYKEVSLYKQARPRRYQFALAQTAAIPTPYESDIETIEEIPRLLPAGLVGVTPAVRFSLNVKAGMTYTVYLLGNWERPRLKIAVNQFGDSVG